MSGLKRLIQEIHRRSLWQVLAIYAVASWVIYEVVQGLLSLSEAKNKKEPLKWPERD